MTSAGLANIQLRVQQKDSFHVGSARRLLKTLVDNPLRCEAIREGDRKSYRITGTGSYLPLLPEQLAMGAEFIGKPIKALRETVSAISGCLIYSGNASSLNDKKPRRLDGAVVNLQAPS